MNYDDGKLPVACNGLSDEIQQNWTFVWLASNPQFDWWWRIHTVQISQNWSYIAELHSAKLHAFVAFGYMLPPLLCSIHEYKPAWAFCRWRWCTLKSAFGRKFLQDNPTGDFFGVKRRCTNRDVYEMFQDYHMTSQIIGICMVAQRPMQTQKGCGVKEGSTSGRRRIFDLLEGPVGTWLKTVLNGSNRKIFKLARLGWVHAVWQAGMLNFLRKVK